MQKSKTLPNFFRESLNFVLHGSLRAVHTIFHANSGVCSSKNVRVIALGTKEDTIRGAFSSDLYHALYKGEK